MENNTLDEKLITFNNRAQYGQIVFLAGGAASGKGFAVDKFIDSSSFKIRDVDKTKTAIQKMDALGKISLDYVIKKFGEKIKDSDIKYIKTLMSNGVSLSDLDLRNPDHVYILHIISDAIGIKDKSLVAILTGKDNPETLPNILFDITAKKPSSITKVLPQLLKVGYTPNNIHLTWVLTKYTAAISNNKSRDRVVPDDIMLTTHVGAKETVWDMITNGIPKGINGRVDVILNNKKNTVVWVDSKGNPIKTKATGLPADGRKRFGKNKATVVVSDFLSLPIKPAGGSIYPESKWKRRLYNWIYKNAPKDFKSFGMETPKDMPEPKYKKLGIGEIIMNEAVKNNITVSKDGYVKKIKHPMTGKMVKSVKVDGETYRYNPVYKTYNSVKNNELLNYTDVSKIRYEVFKDVIKEKSKKYTDQTGTKSAILKDVEFSSLIDNKQRKFIMQSDVKIFATNLGSFIFTDGKREFVVSRKPFKILKNLSRARSEVIDQYNHVVNETIFYSIDLMIEGDTVKVTYIDKNLSNVIVEFTGVDAYNDSKRFIDEKFSNYKSYTLGNGVNESITEAKGDFWYIEKWDSSGDETTVKKYTTFDKNKIQSDFDKIAKSLKDGEEVHFVKDTEKYMGEYLLSVVNKGGKLKREITKGSKTYYKPYTLGNGVNESVNESYKKGDVISIDPKKYPDYKFPKGTRGKIVNVDKADYASDDDVYDVKITNIEPTGDTRTTLSVDSPDQIKEAAHGYKDSTASYITKHNNEFKAVEKINSGNEMKFYDSLSNIEEKMGRPKYMTFISNALRGYGVDMYKDPKIKNKQEAEEALYLLSK